MALTNWIVFSTAVHPQINKENDFLSGQLLKNEIFHFHWTFFFRNRISRNLRTIFFGTWIFNIFSFQYKKNECSAVVNTNWDEKYKGKVDF